MEISVVIPALNEAENLAVLLPQIKEVLVDIKHEIIVVDGKSTDNTREIAARLGTRVIIQESKGFGGALRDGFAICKGEYVLQMDADFSHDPYFIPKLLQHRGRADLVMGSRYVHGGSMEAPFIRRSSSFLLNKFSRYFMRIPVKDMSSGFRLYRKKALDEIKTTAIQLEIQQEMIVKLFDKGFKIVEVPFIVKPREKGVSKVHLVKYGSLILRSLVRLNKLRRS